MVLLAIFGQIYKYQRQQAEQKNLKNLKFWPEGTTYKIGAIGSMTAEEISAIKKKPSVL